MSDDKRRDDTGGYGTDFGDDFGTVEFADDDKAPTISFGDDTGPLPHWTEPPTAELPRTPQASAAEDDVWSTFSKPAVQPTAPPPQAAEPRLGLFDEPADPSSGTYRDEPTREVRYFDDESSVPTPAPAPRRESRLVIGSDPTDERLRRPEHRPAQGGQPRAGAATGPTGRPPVTRGARPAPSRDRRGPNYGRDLPQAVTAGLIIAAAFIAALMWRPAAVMLFIVAVVGLASVEFFNKVTEKGYRPATFAGIAACIAGPLAAYWIGDGSLPLVFTFAFAAAAVGFIGAPGVQSGPLPNVAITTLASVWIGLLGSYAALIVRYSTESYGVPGFNVGTDTLFIVAVGVVANDVFALFVGSAAGRTPLREWISPSKSVEGLIGGTVGTFLAVAIIGTQSGTWDRTSEWILLALIISVLAPIGDLVESMFKRNLDVKDFGTFIPGHGGVLDRFDGFLFVLPGAYYLMLVIQPWVQ
jgi:phosphatidate cytidylyltransferase